MREQCAIYDVADLEHASRTFRRALVWAGEIF